MWNDVAQAPASNTKRQSRNWLCVCICCVDLFKLDHSTFRHGLSRAQTHDERLQRTCTHLQHPGVPISGSVHPPSNRSLVPPIACVRPRHEYIANGFARTYPEGFSLSKTRSFAPLACPGAGRERVDSRAIKHRQNDAIQDVAVISEPLGK